MSNLNYIDVYFLKINKSQINLDQTVADVVLYLYAKVSITYIIIIYLDKC